MNTLQQIEKLQEHYSNYKSHFQTRVSQLPDGVHTVQDYQYAMQFVEQATNRITHIEAEEMIPSMIDYVLCRTNQHSDGTTTSSHNDNRPTNTDAPMLGVDVALACRMLHGQNAKYLLHLETILMQYGYISSSQREDDRWEEGLELDATQEQEQEDRRRTRSSILVESFHSEDMEEEYTLEDGLLSMFDKVGEPLKRLSEEEEEDDMNTSSRSFTTQPPSRSQIVNICSNNTTHRTTSDAPDSWNDSLHKQSANTLLSTPTTRSDRPISPSRYSFPNDSSKVFIETMMNERDSNDMKENASYSSSSSSCSEVDALQLDDSIGDDTAELLVSFEDLSVEDPIIYKGEKKALESDDDSDDDCTSEEEEEESLDPTVICDRKKLEDQVFGVVGSVPDDNEKLTSPLDKYQVQILNSGTIGRVSPIANDVEKGSIPSPILKTVHQQPTFSNTKSNAIIQVNNTTELNVSAKDHEQNESVVSIAMHDDDTGNEASYTINCSEDENDTPLLSESGLTLMKLNQTRCNESSFESSIDEDVYESVAGDNYAADGDQFSSGNETRIRARVRSSDSSLEPSTNEDNDADDDYDSSEPSTRIPLISSQLFSISKNMNYISSTQGGHDNNFPKSSSATPTISTNEKDMFSCDPNNEMDNGSVGTFESCISHQGQDIGHTDATLIVISNVKKPCCSTPISQNGMNEQNSPYGSSQKAHVRTPLAAAWIEKYMPDQKEKLLGQLSARKNRPALAPLLVETTGSVTRDTSNSSASPQTSSERNVGAIECLTQREYDEAPRVIKMQVSFSELNQTIHIFNTWFSTQEHNPTSISLQEETAYEILEDCFEKNKSKNLLMSLVHFRRLVMQLSSLAGGGGKRFVIFKK